VRTADPDVIIVQLNQDPDVISSRLIADTGRQPAHHGVVDNRHGGGHRDRPGDDRLARIQPAAGAEHQRLTNLTVRKAISYAIDKATLIGESVGTDSGYVTSTLIPPGLSCNVDNPDPYPFDAAKGRALLNAPAGQQVPLTLVTSSNSTRDLEVRQIANNLASDRDQGDLGEVEHRRFLHRGCQPGMTRIRHGAGDLDTDWPPGTSTCVTCSAGRRLGRHAPVRPGHLRRVSTGSTGSHSTSRSPRPARGTPRSCRTTAAAVPPVHGRRLVPVRLTRRSRTGQRLRRRTGPLTAYVS